MIFFPRSVRGRLWTAFGLLSLAIICISVLTWNALQRVDDQLQDLHRQSLSQVAQAIDLSKRASDLATSAPYLLNQRSNSLIQQEGDKLLAVLTRVQGEWPSSGGDDADRNAVLSLTKDMKHSIEDLVQSSQMLDQVQSFVRDHVAELSTLRELVTRQIEDTHISTEDRLTWWILQSMNADALSAAYADNLIGVGEEQRHYQRQRNLALQATKTTAQIEYLRKLDALVEGDSGIVELRRAEVGLNLKAQNALFRIRRDANQINELTSGFAKRAEMSLMAERISSSNTIQFTRASTAAISLAALGLALIAALYVSRYVAHNIGRVSEAMVRLANGDRSSVLPRRLSSSDDEIGDLFRSFRAFRANALRLDRSNRLLDQRNALFEKVFANITDGIAITDHTGKLTVSNPAFARILSVEKIDGAFVNWLSESTFGKSARDKDLSVNHRGSLILHSEDGQMIEIRTSQLPEEGRVWLISDVTEQRKVAERVEQIDRIELLGKLAGDTAHDFANILASIRTHVHLLSKNLDVGLTDISAIENAVEFGTSLTERLLAFARKQPLSPEIFDLNTLIEGMAELIEIGLKAGVKLTIVRAKEPFPVCADPGQLESAIFNLVLNSNNAIEKEGEIRIELSKASHRLAKVTVTDTGSGMPASIKSKAIQPFFTTRANAGGTGLGLSIVYGFINQSGGTLEIDSEEGKGTCVTLSLPLAKHLTAEQSGYSIRKALLVDDNANDRAATMRVLGNLGYKTTTCPTAQEAIHAMQQEEFDLVVSDFNLNGACDGLFVLAKSLQIRPKAQRILISGKSALNDAKPNDLPFVEKPVCDANIAAALAQN